MLNACILLASLMMSFIGLAIANQALMVTGAVLVCTPFLIKSMDRLLAGKWLEAIITCLGITLYIFICVFILSSDIGKASQFLGSSVLWIVAVGAGTMQLLWMLLINSRH